MNGMFSVLSRHFSGHRMRREWRRQHQHSDDISFGRKLHPVESPGTGCGSSHRTDRGYRSQTLFLRKTARFRQVTGTGYRALELPFAGNEFRLLVVLPDKGNFHSVRNAVNSDWLKQLVAGMEPKALDLSLPLYSVETTAHLPLGALPTTADVAVFSAIDGTKDLYVPALVLYRICRPRACYRWQTLHFRRA